MLDVIEQPCPAQMVKVFGYGQCDTEREARKVLRERPELAHDWISLSTDERYKRCRWCDWTVRKTA